MTKKATHGGKRLGAGRSKSDDPKIQTSLGLTQIVRDYLQSTESSSATAEKAIRGSKGFREYVAKANGER